MAVRITADQTRALGKMQAEHPRGISRIEVAVGSLNTLHVVRHHKNWDPETPARTEVLLASDGRTVHASHEEKETS